MPVNYGKKTVSLKGRVAVEEAEELSNWLQKTPGAAVNVSGCEQLHASALQVLLALQPAIKGEPANPFLRAALAYGQNQTRKRKDTVR